MSDIKDILTTYKKVVVIGISANPDRPSHWIAKYLQEHGFEVIGVNPGNPKILGMKIVRSLDEIEGELEIVDVFRSPDAIPALVEELAKRKPKILWLQPGAQNPDAENHARKLGIEVISGPCIYAEHKALHR